MHDDVTERLRSTATWIDNLLSNDRIQAEGNASWMRLRTDVFGEDRHGVDGSARVTARLVLPGTEDRFHLSLAGDADDEFEDAGAPIDTPTPPSLEGDTSSVSAAAQYFLRATDYNNVRVEAGLRFSDLDPNPYAGLRWRHSTPLGKWMLRATERFRAYRTDGMESRTTVDLERSLAEKVFFRTTSRADWFEFEESLFWGQDFSLYRRTGEFHLLSLEWYNSFLTEPEHILDEVLLAVRYSQRLNRDWVVFEVAPQIAWRDAYDYQPVVGLLLRLDFYFGR